MEGLKASSIELTTKDGSVVKLTIEEAQALYSQLAELFGSKETTRTVPVYPWPRPILISDQWPSPWRPRWEVMCDSSKHLTRTDGSGLSVSY